MAYVKVNAELCKSCQLCVVSCPFKLLSVGENSNHKGYRYVEQQQAEKCTGCKICAIMCPDSAIEVYK